MDPTDFVGALYGAIIGDSHAVGGVQAGSSSYVTLEWPGMPIDPSQYGNIWASDNQTGSPEALENFSSLVDDDLPALAPLYQPTGISLEQVYALILQATVAAGPLANTFAAAQATFAGVIRGSLQNAQVMFHPSSPAPRTWCDPAGEAGWASVSIGTANPTAPPPLPPPVNLKLLLAKQSLMQWQVAALPQRAPPVLTAQPATRVLSMAAASHVALAPQSRPAPAMATATLSRATTMELRPQAVELAVARPAPVISAATLARLQALPTKKVVTSPPIIVQPQPPQPVAATKLGATFRFRRVAILRQWIDTTVFHLPGWSIAGLPAGSLSNGRSDSNPGLLPLIPVAFIAVKDVSINGIWSDSDKAVVNSALTGGSIASFGPFSLVGGGARASFDGSTLRLPGIQIVAWICEVTPVLPPA